jgi:hypothetical protein
LAGRRPKRPTESSSRSDLGQCFPVRPRHFSTIESNQVPVLQELVDASGLRPHRSKRALQLGDARDGVAQTWIVATAIPRYLDPLPTRLDQPISHAFQQLRESIRPLLLRGARSDHPRWHAHCVRHRSVLTGGAAHDGSLRSNCQDSVQFARVTIQSL